MSTFRVQEDFTYHHAESAYVMLVRWLSNEPSTLPANASHHVGVGAFVLNDEQEVFNIPLTMAFNFFAGIVSVSEICSLVLELCGATLI